MACRPGVKMLADPKPCACCGEVLPRSAFGSLNNAKAPRAVKSYCRPCINAKARARNNQTPAAADLNRRRCKLKKFGLTLEDFDRLAQAGCALCEAAEAGGKGRFHVDHDHATGAFRGLLCHSCNTGLGHFKDQSAVLEKAARYVRQGGLR